MGGEEGAREGCDVFEGLSIRLKKNSTAIALKVDAEELSRTIFRLVSSQK